MGSGPSAFGGRSERKLGQFLLTNSYRSNCPFAQCRNLNTDRYRCSSEEIGGQQLKNQAKCGPSDGSGCVFVSACCTIRVILDAFTPVVSTVEAFYRCKRSTFPLPRVFKATPVPWLIAQLFTNPCKFLRTGYFGRMRDAKGDHFSALNCAITYGTVHSNEQKRQPFSEAAIIKIEHHRRNCMKAIAKNQQRYWFPKDHHATMRCPRAHAFSKKMTN